ncbi:DUF1302 domain-containing protein [Pseudomonas sp. CAN2814]|uniref:DUF1302 domain-containing protein n=1 Tax=Pseudomonas sp. CAN1 TaxID=3046726 RepID=UPI0026499B8C|nr:DUF1302 domain-containing protein [Pseudomonas sp. CAN1]MDN6860773.1 DUF1302 domain-containing protein [Pseudomonas sp. CAN1]
MTRIRIAFPPLPLALAISGAGLLLASQAQALSYQFNDDLQLNLDTTLSYSLAWRTEKRAHALSNGGSNPAIANGDDGDNAFDRGALINNRASFLTEADLKFRGDYGLFVRATGFYDDVYQRGNDNDTGTSNCFAGGRCSKPDHFSGETEDQAGDDLRLLDTYVYGTWDLSGHTLNARAGNQVVAWGESLFNGFGIAGAMSPVDATKANTPGIEVKELFLPVGQLFTQYSLTDNLGVQLYYQYQWKRNELTPVGHFFSTTDYIDEGGFNDATGQQRRLGDDTPGNSGQYGAALTYTVEQLNNTEFGLYYLRFSDHSPQLDFLSDWNTGNYRAIFYDDIKLYGASFSSMLGETNVSGELSYRDGQPVLVDTGLTPQPVRANVAQALVSFIHSYGAMPFADNTTLTGEVGYNRVMDNDRAPSFDVFVPTGAGVAQIRTPNTDKLYYDRSAWGYTLNLTLDYNNVFNGWDLSVPIIYSQAVNGNSSMPGSFGLGEGDDRFAVGTTWRYLNNFSIEARYNMFLGNPSETTLADRDNLSLTAKYSF